MPGKRRSAAQLARDRRKIANLYLQGWIQADIADELTISQQTISNDLKALQSEWLASALVDFDEAKSQELAKIDRLEREYWQAWARSCEDAEQTTQEGTPAKVDKVKKTSKGQAGDPRFLQGVQWCIERRCKILGVDAPEKVEHSGSVEVKDKPDLGKLTDDELEELARISKRVYSDAGGDTEGTREATV